MTVFTYEKVKRLIEAADVLLTNIYDAEEHTPQSPDVQEYNDFPRDEDGEIVYPDVWELHCAWKALVDEDKAEITVS